MEEVIYFGLIYRGLVGKFWKQSLLSKKRRIKIKSLKGNSLAELLVWN
jgi:hypothetical protein